MSYEETPLHTIAYNRGFNAGASRLSPSLEGHTAEGSSNALWLGEGYYQPFRGVSTQGAGTGSRVMKPFGETWGGIKDISAIVATGTVSEEIGRSVWGIGSGQVHRAGTNITGYTLSTFLKVALRNAGTYGTPFTAGLAQPSAPQVGVMTTPGDPDGAVSFKIERHRPSTGGLSVASLTSEVIIPQGNEVRIGPIPAASAGQTHWRVFATLFRFGGQGIHYAVPYNGSIDIPESVVAAGTVEGSAATATGTYTFVNPTDGETIVVNGVTFTFKSAPAVATDVLIGASATETATNFAAVLEASTHASLIVAGYAAVATLLTITYGSAGVGGNSYTLANSSGGNVTRSAATLAGGVDGDYSRSLVFSWKDGDLVPVEASYDDYSPQAATHHLRIESVMALAGSFADATSSPSSTNTGSAVQISKENNYESYIPTSLLFLPERVVDTLSRPIDSHGFIACENSIHAIQYVGEREDLPSCTVTTILQDQGILYPHNWCHFRGRLAVITAEGNWLLMSEDGSIDSEWAAPIRSFIRTWLPADTPIGYDPKNDCLVVFNGRVALAFSLQKNEWSNPVYLQDYGIAAGTTVQSCQTAKRRLYVTLKNGANFTAYEWDTGAVDPVPVSFVSHYASAPNRAAAKNIYQASLAIETNVADTPIVVCINRNLQRIAFRSITANSVSELLMSADNGFNIQMDGKRFALFGPDVGGAGIDYLIGVVDYDSASQITMRTLGGNILEAQTSLESALMFVGDYVDVLTADEIGAEHLPDIFPNVPECKSFATAVWFQTNDHVGSMLNLNLFGTVSPSARV